MLPYHGMLISVNSLHQKHKVNSKRQSFAHLYIFISKTMEQTLMKFVLELKLKIGNQIWFVQTVV